MLAKVSLAIAVVALLITAVIVWRFAIFILPFRWTGELNRLAGLLNVQIGSTVADVGAGDGSFALAMARLVGPSGTVYATELSAKQLDVIKKKVTESGNSRVRVVEASAAATNLPEQCCDAIYLRTVLHHIADRKAFAHQVRKAVLPKGRLAVIDFAPGDLWFHGRDHGVTSQAAIEAFRAAGWSLIDHQPHWGGGLYLLLFERPAE